MKKLAAYLRENRIIAIIGFVLFLAVLNAVFSLMESKSAQEYENISKEVATVKNALNKVNTHVNLADMSFRGFFIVEDQQLLHPFTDQVLAEYGPNYDRLYEILKKHGFDVSSVPVVKAKVADYMNLINHMVALRKQQKLDEIVKILQSDPGYEVWKVYDKLIKDATQFEDELEAASLRQFQFYTRINMFIQILLLAFGIPTLFISILKIVKNDKLKLQLFESIDDSNRRYIFNDNAEANKGDQKFIILTMIENLKKISAFIKAITKGDYSVNWEGYNDQNKAANKDNIVGDLINMREQMKAVKERDEKRIWITEGTAKFSEIIRTYQHNVGELSYQVISNLVKYLNANQGGIFVLVDSDSDSDNPPYLDLKACYAYQRKKFLNKRVEIGEGLVGQAYLEGEMIFLTEIPDKYAYITSGLGDANPKNLIILPLKYNDRIEAIIEIAAFKAFEEHEIEFLKKTGEFVAAAIAAVKISERTNTLLENSKEQAEEMKAQEEELKQNLEEMFATQEEVRRKTNEYLKMIEEKNLEIDELTNKLKKYENVAAA